MAQFKYTEIPNFAKREEDALLFNQDGYLVYYIPENYFGNMTKIQGSYVKVMGSFYYQIFDENDKGKKLSIFNYPTMFQCKPGKIEKKKQLVLGEDFVPSDYRLLYFYKGDQLITRVHVEQYIDNVQELFRLHIMTGRIPNGIPYNTLYEYPFEAMGLNSGAYAAHSQAMGLLYSKLCRDPSDVSRPFRLSKYMDSGKMTGYTSISIKDAAKYVSPFVSFTSENLDESIMSAVLLSNKENTGKIEHIESPLERLFTM